MRERVMLVRTTGYRVMFVVLGVIALFFAGVLAVNALSGGTVAVALSRGAPSFLIGTAIFASLFLVTILGNYMEMGLCDHELDFKGLFGRNVSYRVDTLEKITTGRALYTFTFRVPEERLVNLYTYLSPDKLAGILEQIAEHREDPDHRFQFAYGNRDRTF